MDAGLWARAKSVFFQALEVPLDERAQLLDRSCGTSGVFRLQVDYLLSNHEAADGFLEGPAPWLEESAVGPEESLIEGHRLGAWEIARELGRGGMGTVYLALRADALYHQEVAIKVIRRGMDTDDIVRRFRQERQILAGLDHPSIGRLLDGGTTPDGRPFLVMEYINGKPIDSFCDDQQLSIAERLELFCGVCAAVHHAHQRLVVHRDIKPSNILVTAEGVAKLVDFGIAKLLGPDLAFEPPLSTVHSRRVMTPDYASPEHVRGLPITTASDIYSLGVLLYELLSGYRPFQLAGLLPHEIEDVIVTAQPARPSSRVSTSQGSLAANRQTDEDRLRRQLCGDLDNIALKALRPEPQDRYASADELARDLRRHLDGRPVRARAATVGYRARKFISRHRSAVAATVLVWVALAAGMMTTLWQASHAKEQEKRAEAERDRAELLLEEARSERLRAQEISSFLIDVFRVVEPGEARGQLPTAEEILIRGAAKIRRELAEQPVLRATMMDTIGHVYYNLGAYDRASAHFDEALELRRENLVSDHQDIATSLYHRGWVEHALGRLGSARDFYQQALEIRRRSLPAAYSHEAEILNELGELAWDQGKFEEAEELVEEGLRLRRKTLRPGDPEIAISLSDLAALRGAQGHLDEAESLYRQALTIYRQSFGDVHPKIATVLKGLGGTLRQLGRLEEAGKLVREALAQCRHLHGEEHRSVAANLNDLAWVEMERGKTQEAERLFQDSLARYRRMVDADHPHLAMVANNLGELYIRLEEWSLARPLLEEALGARRRRLGEAHPLTGHTAMMIGKWHLEQGDPLRAEPLLQEAVKINPTARGELLLASCQTALAKRSKSSAISTGSGEL